MFRGYKRYKSNVKVNTWLNGIGTSASSFSYITRSGLNWYLDRKCVTHQLMGSDFSHSFIDTCQFCSGGKTCFSMFLQHN